MARVRGTAPIRVLLAGAMLVGTVPVLFAYPWTTVGSTGIVDIAHLNIAAFNNGAVFIRSDVPAPSMLRVRYNVVLPPPGGGLTVNPFPYRLRVRYMDNGPGAGVIVRLKGYNIVTGTIANVFTFDSNLFAPEAGMQTQATACIYPAFDIHSFAYFIDVDLNRTALGGDPRLAIVHIEECPY